MQVEPDFLTIAVRVVIDVVDAAGVEGTGTADDAMDFVALGKQQFSEIRTVLSGDASDESFFHLAPPFFMIIQKCKYNH
jgi:hypothetical protein